MTFQQLLKQLNTKEYKQVWITYPSKNKELYSLKLIDNPDMLKSKNGIGREKVEDMNAEVMPGQILRKYFEKNSYEIKKDN